MRIIVLDSETTGLSPENGHKIIEFGAVEMINGSLTGNNLQLFYDPKREVDEEAYAVHGWDRENLVIKSGGKTFSDQYHELMSFLGDPKDTLLVAHNAPFDMDHLDAECRRINSPEISKLYKVSDSYVLANNLFPGQRNNLNSLAARLKVDTSERVLHGALLDSKILASVYVKLLSKQDELIAKRGVNQSQVSFNVSNRSEIPKRSIQADLSSKLKVVSLSDADNESHKEMMGRIEKSSGLDDLTF